MRTIPIDDIIDGVLLAFAAVVILYALSECAFALTHPPEEAVRVTHPENNVILYPILESSWLN